VSEDLSRVLGVPVEVRVELGRKEITIGELLSVAAGDVIMMDRLIDAGADIYAAERPIGEGDVVVIDDEFGVRVSELYNDGAPAKPEPVAAPWGRQDEDAAA
jgi:flagellar motor switch protein FliN